MTKPVCVSCQRFYRPKKNGIYVHEKKPIGGALVSSGNEAPEMWEDYKILMADLWICQGCGHQMVTGYGHGTIAEHFQPNFKSFLKKLEEHGTVVTVNDC